MASRHFIAAPGDTIRLKTRFFANGILVDPESFPDDVKIYTTAVGGTPIATIAPTQEAVGIWYVDYQIPNNFAATEIFDEWVWIGESGMASNTQRYRSEIDLIDAPQPPGSDFVASPVDAVGHIFSAVTKTQKTPPKSGFTVKAPPRSIKESISQSHDRLKTITKSAVEQYIRSFLDTSGRNRDMIESIAKGSLQYITDKSLNAQQDRTKRATQLARLFNEIREYVPAILIVDAGVQSIPSGLMSGLTHSTLINGKWQGWFCKQFKVPLTIVVLTGDQDSTDQLMEIVELPFNNLRQMGGGSEIRPQEPGHNWVVRLPLGIDISGTTGSNIGDDAKDQLWFSEFSLAVDAEDTFAVESTFDTSLSPTAYDGDFFVGQKPNQSNIGFTTPPVITAPDTISINSVATVTFSKIRHHHKIVIDRPMIATIDVGGRTITPRRLGTFTLQVLDLKSRDDGTGPRAMAPVVAAEKSITVTL